MRDADSTEIELNILNVVKRKVSRYGTSITHVKKILNDYILEREIWLHQGETDVATMVQKKDIIGAIKRAKMVYVMGNGGSAGTADHFVNDLMKISGVRAISLSSNLSVLTAYANDNGYENCFKDQLKVLLDPEDLVITISTSGKSQNLIRAIKYAKSIGAGVYEFPYYLEDGTQGSEDKHLQHGHELCLKLLAK